MKVHLVIRKQSQTLCGRSRDGLFGTDSIKRATCLNCVKSRALESATLVGDISK